MARTIKHNGKHNPRQARRAARKMRDLRKSTRA